MDLKGSLVDANLKIYPAKRLLSFLEALPIEENMPVNILKFVKNKDYKVNNIKEQKDTTSYVIQLNNEDINNLCKIKKLMDNVEIDKIKERKSKDISEKNNENQFTVSSSQTADVPEDTIKESVESKSENEENQATPFLTTADIDWLYTYLQKRKKKGDTNVPYLHILLEGINIEMPENRILKRNPALEARCVKLRAQQEAREYRKMTKSVDNVRMRFPEDSISYQLKQLNRQLIAIGQFIISIFAGFLFGFRGVELMVGSLDFGFRLLLGVMCALVIALAEIYFLAKKLNEELNIPETVQLGGPPKFVNETNHGYNVQSSINKEHQD